MTKDKTEMTRRATKLHLFVKKLNYFTFRGLHC